MTKTQKALLLAMAIGDGYISKQGALVLAHSPKQRAYLEYKRNLVFSICGGKYPTIRSWKTTQGYWCDKFTKGNKYFRNLRKWLYPNDKKKLSRHLLDRLTPHGLAIWWMDDGSLFPKIRTRNGCREIHAFEGKLSLYDPLDEVAEVQQYFIEKWDLHPAINKGKGWYLLRFNTTELRNFIPIIKPFVIPSMQYKTMLDPLYWHERRSDLNRS